MTATMASAACAISFDDPSSLKQSTDDDPVDRIRRPIRHLQETIHRLNQPVPIDPLSNAYTARGRDNLPRKPEDWRYARRRQLGRIKERKHDGVERDADLAIRHGSMLEGAKSLRWNGQFDIPDADGIASAVCRQGPRKEGTKSGTFREGLHEDIAIRATHDGIWGQGRSLHRERLFPFLNHSKYP